MLAVFSTQLFIRQMGTLEATGKQKAMKEGAMHSLLQHPHRVQAGLVTAVFRARCSRARAGRENPHQSFETSWENCQKPVSQPTPFTDLGVMGGGKPRVKKDLRSHCAGPTLKIHLHRLMRTRDHLSLLLYHLFGALEGSKTAQLH